MRSTTAALAALLTAALTAKLSSGGAATLFNDSCVRATDWDKRAPDALRKRGVERALWLVWRDDADRASAALLLRRLAEHRRCRRLTCRLALCHAPHGLCPLLDAARGDADLDAAFVAGVQPLSAMSCPDARYLSAVGRRLAPLLPRTLVALAPAAASRPACAAAADPAFHSSSDDSERRACLFEPGDPERRARSAGDLRALVAAGGEVSFRFRDAELWADEPRVLTLRDAEFEPALMVAEEVNLLIHAPWALAALREHAPPARALRDLLAREVHDASASGAERGRRALRAAEDARAEDAPSAPEGDPLRYRALVYLCSEDEWGSAAERRDLFAELLGEVARWTRPHLVEVQAELETVPCAPGGSTEPELGARLQRTLRAPGAHRVLGAVAAGAGAEAAARLASEVPVVTYDAQGAGGALQAGARAERLAAALSAALAGCGWGRVAVLSEGGAAAARVEAALRAAGPVRRAPLPTDEGSLRATLRSLRTAQARVVVVNAGGRAAERALRLAAEEGLAEGCAWLAREWSAASPPPVPLLTLSAAPRSAAELGAGAAEGAAGVLGRRWRADRWPAPLVPLTEALLTLSVGSARLFSVREELRYDHVAEGTPESLRRILRNETLPGVGRDLTFDERGARPRPPRLQLWEPGHAAPRDLEPASLPAACPAVASAPRCHLPAGGDAFHPAHCLDLTCAVGLPALLLAALLAGHGAAALRRRAAARARTRLMLLRAEAGAALLARQGRAGADLRALLVERERVTLERALGAGRHGRVWLARLAPRGLRLAAKGPHAGAAPAEEGELLREASALAPLRHAHVVRLLGVCVGPGPPLLLTAVAAHGDLLRYLRARRPPGGGAGEAEHVAAPALTRLAREAALALAYLASRGVVHRDVRAANCLLDERRSLRLADFGMARSLAGDGEPAERGGERAAAGEYYACRRRALFPVLWMAPESLARGAFSCASDVWSLGVLALELVSLGARPFGALGAAEAVALVSRGGHAPLPDEATAETRRLARACWRREASARPTAAEVAEWLAARGRALAPCPNAASAPRAPDADSGLDEPDAS